MLKYNEIIKELSDGEKIRLLCDISCLSDKTYKALGIPELNVRNMDDLGHCEYPSSCSMANTWDPLLVGQVADDLYKKGLADKINFVKVPSPRIKINPYRRAISEDPMLASAMSEAYIKAAERADVAIGLPEFGLHKDEPEWLDKNPDDRFGYEMLVRPYYLATENKKCAAVLTREDLAEDAYHTVNTRLMEMVKNGQVVKNATRICSRVSAEHIVLYLASGGLCFESSALTVESALSRYKQISKDIAHGKSTPEELQAEVVKGKAIAPETIDQAVSRMLDFVFAAKRKSGINPINVPEHLNITAAEQATVLLKNEHHVLPLRKGRKIGLIGDIAMNEGAQEGGLLSALRDDLGKAGFEIAGIARGYDFSAQRSDSLEQDAIDLAAESDIILLFLGIPEEKIKIAHKTKQMAIPANQQALLDKLGKFRDRVVTIIPSDYSADICYPDHCAALMMFPIEVGCGARALTNVLTGKSCPGGRLANTLYCNTEREYIQYKTYHERDGLKTGCFVGYRYYDLAQEAQAFPFGHGLGYGNVTYSLLAVKGNVARIELKNQGKSPTVEVPQVYLGMPSSCVIRPEKELCGFAHVKLKAGETKTVEIPFSVPVVYDAEHGDYVQEGGIYTVYVGASVSDIRASKQINLTGDTLGPDQKNISDYIHSRTNIFSDNYKLEAKIKAMKKSVFNIIAGALALVLAVLLKLFCVSQDLYYGFFDWFALALAVAGVVFFIAEIIRRNRLRSEEQKRIDRVVEQTFEQAEQIPVYSANNMFVEEFDTTEEVAAESASDQIEGVETEYLQYIDKDQTFDKAAAEFEVFAAQRGCKFRHDQAKKVFAALASSRLIVLDGMSDKAMMTLVRVLCAYFGSDMFVDRVDETYTSNDRVLFATDQNGYKTKTNVNMALTAAQNTHRDIHFAVMTNVSCAALPLYFTPFVNYAKNPSVNNHFVALNQLNVESSFYIAQNTWFILNLASNERADRLPEFISDIAVVTQFEFDEYAAAEHTVAVSGFTYYQMDYLAERAANRIAVDENLWKKLDRFEEYVASNTPFHIGNKLFLCLERFAYVYLACGGDAFGAVDEAVAAKLMIPAMTALSSQGNVEDLNLGEMIETILGEDHAEACKKTVLSCIDRKA